MGAPRNRRGHRWQPGQSGNPRGRRPEREIADVRAAAREWTAAAIATLAEIMQNKKAPPAARGAAAQALLDRGWGKPAQQLQVEQPEEIRVFLRHFGPGGEEIVTPAEQLTAPERGKLIEDIDAELERRGKVIEAPFRRLPGPSTGWFIPCSGSRTRRLTMYISNC